MKHQRIGVTNLSSSPVRLTWTDCRPLLALSAMLFSTGCVLTTVGHPEGMEACEPDTDHDGVQAWTESCYDPNTHEEVYVGWSPLVDCNNSDASIYPGAIEYSDGKDNDCNGIVDDPEWVKPVDHDGDGYTIEGGDCDDYNSNIHPGAVDLPQDTIDSNCSDFSTEIETPPPPQYDYDAESLQAETTFYSNSSVPDFIGYTRVLQDMDGDGAPELAISHVGPDRLSKVDIIYGPLAGLTGAMSYSQAADWTLSSSDGPTMNGVRVDSGDINCDGYADLISGDHLQRRVHVFFGGPRRTGEVSVEQADLIFRPIDEGSYKIGSMLQVPGDLDGDGCDELLISQGAYDWWTGRAVLFYGRSDWSTVISSAPVVDVSSADASFVSTYELDFSGARFGRIGDLDQDGYDDVSILTGWSVTDSPTPECPDCGVWGKYAFYYGGSERLLGEYNVDHAPATLIPDDSLTWLLTGSSLSAGDFDNDGHNDIVLGMPFVWSANDQYLPVGGIGMILYGAGGRLNGSYQITDFSYTILRPIDRYDVFGEFQGVGDLTGDGIDDVAMVSTMNLQYLWDDYYPRPGYVAIFKGATGRPATRYAGESTGGIVYGGYGSMEHVFPIDVSDVTMDGVSDLIAGTQFFFYDVPRSSTLIFHGGSLP